MSDIRKFMRERNKYADEFRDEGEDEKALEKKLKRHKLGKFTKWFILLLVIIAGVAIYIIQNNKRVFTEY